MRYGTRIEFDGVSQEQYDAMHTLIQSLTDDSDPIVLHIAGPTSSGWYVLEVWESKADQQRFMQKILPHLPPGAPMPTVQEFDVYSCLTAEQLRAERGR